MSDIKTRRFWTKLETLAFLSSYAQRKDEFLRSKNSILVYEIILEDLVSQNVLNQPTTAQMLCCKMKSLIRAYRAACESQNATGACSSDFGYMDEMESIFGRRLIAMSRKHGAVFDVGAHSKKVTCPIQEYAQEIKILDEDNFPVVELGDCEPSTSSAFNDEMDANITRKRMPNQVNVLTDIDVPSASGLQAPFKSKKSIKEILLKRKIVANIQKDELRFNRKIKYLELKHKKKLELLDKVMEGKKELLKLQFELSKKSK